MPQYGADGYALKPRHTHPYILSRCSQGTRMRTTANHPVRMLFKAAPTLLGPARFAGRRRPRPDRQTRQIFEELQATGASRSTRIWRLWDCASPT